MSKFVSQILQNDFTGEPIKTEEAQRTFSQTCLQISEMFLKLCAFVCLVLSVEAQRPTVTSTYTTVTTTTVTSTILTASVCVKYTANIGPCRKRRGTWLDLDSFLKKDDENYDLVERQFISPTSVLRYEVAATIVVQAL